MLNKSVLSFVLLIFTLINESLLGQLSDLKFEKISIEHGLSQSTVHSILQDDSGFLWFGTQSGLNKYDGSNFTIYVHDPQKSNSISENWINSICKDKYGNIWVGTLGGGLNKFDVKTEKFHIYKNDPNDQNSLCNDKIQVVFSDKSGYLWIGTDGGGLDRYDIKNNIFKNYNSDTNKNFKSNRITAITKDSKNNIWIGTQGEGIIRFEQSNLASDQCKNYIQEPGNPYSISSNNVKYIYEDSDEVIWIATDLGLNKYDYENDNFTCYKNDPENLHSLSNNDVRSILEDKNGMLWIATDGGINIFDKNKNIFWRNLGNPSEQNSLSSDDVKTIYIDRSEIIWIGTKGGGLNKFDWGRRIFKHHKNISGNPNTIIDNNVYSIYVDNLGHLWVGTIKGLHKFDKSRKKLLAVFRHDPAVANSLSDDLVRKIYQDKKGTIWVGTNNGGLNKYLPSINQFERFLHDPENPTSISNNTVRTMFEDSEGNFWIGTWEGLDKLDRKTNKFTHYKHDPKNSKSISDNRVRCILEDSNGILWIATYHGLNQFDPVSGEFSHYIHDEENPNSLSHNRILTLYEDKNGVLWVGTYGGGLNKFDNKTNTFIRYSEKDGLIDNAIYGILGDANDNLWISTNKGISKYNLVSNNFKNFNVSDGLQSNEFNGGAYYRKNDGELFFGGINGFNSFYPQDYKENNFIPPILLTSFKIYDKTPDLSESISTLKEIKLSYRQNFISFEFASLDFTNPEKNKFAYKLEGFDTDWNYCGNRKYANYTNLHGGEYIFRVKGTNSDGKWNEEGTSIKIIIVPPFWNTWWFRILLAIVLIVSIYIFYKLRVNRIEKQRKTLRQQVKERTSELISTNKNLRKAKNESQRREAQATLLNNLGQKISSNLELNTLLNEIVEFVRDAFKHYRVLLYILEKNGKGLTLQSVSGVDTDKNSSKNCINLGVGMIGQAASSGKLQLSNDVTSNIHFISENDSKIKSEISIPIKIGSNVFGVLDIQNDKLNAFDETDVKTIETYASQIASAINNARLYEQAQKEIKVRKKAEKESKKLAKQARLLNEVGQRISSELEFSSVLNQIVTSARDAFDYFCVMLLLPDKNRKGLLLQSIAGDYENMFPDDMYIKSGEGMTGRAFKEKKIQISNDVSKNSDFVKKADEITKSEIAIPIMDGKDVIGVLDIESDKLNAFDKTDIATMETFSTQIAAAIKNANLYNHAQLEIKERKKTQQQLIKSRDNLTLAKKETDNILDNVKEGLFLLNKKFQIGSQYSKALESIFEQQNLGKIDFLEYLQNKITDKEAENTKQFLELMFDENIEEGTIYELNPLSNVEMNLNNEKGVYENSKFLSFKFQRITKGNKIVELIVTVNDETDQVNLKQQLKESENKTKKQMEWLLNILHVEPQLLQEFIESVKKEINSIEYLMKNGNQEYNYDEILENIYRSVHLIKGNASLLDLKFFVNSTHEYEENIIKIKEKKNISGGDFVPLILKLGDLRTNLNEINGLIERISKFHSHFRPKRSYENQMLMKSIKNLINNLAKDSGVKVQFEHGEFNGDNLPYQYRLLVKDILIQMVRNTISHGIESEEERLAKGKEGHGVIKVSSKLRNDELVIQYFDDGRGIQIDKLKRKVIESRKWENREIEQWNDDQLLELIFESGISTSDKANVVAGRGLGMDIIKKKIEKSNGRIEYQSEAGKYCQFIIHLPINENQVEEPFDEINVKMEVN